MIYKTTKIKLLPEYEVYDSIFGKPKREKGESYNSELIENQNVTPILTEKISDYKNCY